MMVLLQLICAPLKSFSHNSAHGYARIHTSVSLSLYIHICVFLFVSILIFSGGASGCLGPLALSATGWPQQILLQNRRKRKKYKSNTIHTNQKRFTKYNYWLESCWDGFLSQTPAQPSCISAVLKGKFSCLESARDCLFTVAMAEMDAMALFQAELEQMGSPPQEKEACEKQNQ